MTRREHTVGARLRLDDAVVERANGNGHANPAAAALAVEGRGGFRRHGRGLRPPWHPAGVAGAGQPSWFDLDGPAR